MNGGVLSGFLATIYKIWIVGENPKCFEVFIDEKTQIMSPKSMVFNDILMFFKNALVFFYTKFNTVVNFLISRPNHIFAQKLIFLIDKNFKSLRVFSYDLDFSFCCQKTTQNTPIHCESFSVHEKLEFLKILWFIAWPPHMLFAMSRAKSWQTSTQTQVFYPGLLD